jgi:ferritin-like metal-binding protein YciE
MIVKIGRKFFSNLGSLEELFQEQLQDLYDAEHQILKALPKMITAASSPELKRAFEAHLQQTQGQVRRLEQVFDQIGAKAQGKTCVAMQGLISEGEELMSMRADPTVMDAGLIAAGQRVEHYEIAGYGCLRTWALQLGLTQAAQLLQQTLNEEEQTDKQLTQIAERAVNVKAAQS